MVRGRETGVLKLPMRQSRFRFRGLLSFALVWMFFHSAIAHADIGLLLSDPTGDGSSRFTEAGHASVYLSRVCPASPVQLRLCEPGEQGSVLSNYSRLGETKDYEWNIIPLSVFLYGFDDPSQRPLVASLPLKHLLEEQYRRSRLGDLCSSSPCTTDTNLNWRDMVAVTFVRGVYLFAVHTTEAQDEKFVQDFNARANVNHYNGITNNCADFARKVIAQYFTHATSPDYLNDFGMTSPKAVARSFTHYAQRRPELGLYIMRIAQLPSDRRLTGVARGGTEAMMHQKKWVLPLLLLRGYELPIVGATYMLTGRFNPEKEQVKHPPSLVLSETTGNPNLLLRARTDPVGDHPVSSAHSAEQQWRQYRERFSGILRDAQKSGVESDSKSLNRLLVDANRQGSISQDDNGQFWMNLEYKGKTAKIGVQSSNVLDPDSDPELGFALQLAKVNRILSSKRKHREGLVEFEKDWHLLERLRSSAQERRTAEQSSPAGNPSDAEIGLGTLSANFQ